MALKPIYFKSQNDLGYVKAIVREEDVEFFSSLGPVYQSSLEIPEDGVEEDEDDAVLPTKDPDKGFGEPGTKEWFESNVLSYDSKVSIISYVSEVTGTKISPAGSLAAVKKRALNTIWEYLKNDDQSE